MKKGRLLCMVGVAVLWAISLRAAEYRIGVARVEITPAEGLWMAGYAARKHPAEGALHPLWAKALVVEDKHGQRVVIVTADLIGDNFGRQLSDAIGAAVSRRTGIGRQRIVVNFSHTHCGPVVRVSDGALVTYGLDEGQRAAVTAYARTLEDKLVNLVTSACTHLQPATLSFGEGKATFAANRRKRYNPDGPVDHTVPVLRVADEKGRLLAVLFGYACHTTTLGSDFYRYNGDYAGFAQIALEAAHPGARAMFIAGCGADINPSPRGTVQLAEQHGKSLAGAVDEVLGGDLHPVRGALAVAFARVDLPFVDPPDRETLQARRGQGNVYDQRLTEVLLKRLSRQGSLERAYPCPVQVVRFGRDLTFVALGGEVVVDYVLRLRREFPGQRLWVAGYCNEVFAYVPSERVLTEGGYEGGGAMKYFGWHGPFKPGVEDRVVGQVKKLVRETARSLTGRSGSAPEAPSVRYTSTVPQQ